ncbi:MAG: hypothetical protein IID41_16820 [Planctomycetes bacterium]|nr:hypothetical protein [Planctomycetota bacterium]
MSGGPPVSLNQRLQQHPDFGKLKVSGDYYWGRMMASVERPSTVSGEIRQLRNEVRKLRRVVGEVGR